MKKTVLGRIECPHCGMAEGMRVTLDRSQNPFGFCDGGCGGQLLVGGKNAPERRAAFLRRHPHIAAALAASENPEPERTPEPDPEPVPTPKNPEPTPAPAARRSPFFL